MSPSNIMNLEWKNAVHIAQAIQESCLTLLVMKIVILNMTIIGLIGLIHHFNKQRPRHLFSCHLSIALCSESFGA